MCGIEERGGSCIGMKTETQTSLIGRDVVVVEIGGDWFKLIHVVNGSHGAVIKKVVLRKADEVETLYGPDFLKSMGVPDLKGLPVIVCLPRQAVNVRLFDLPSGDLSEISDMIDLQIARQTPYSREEIVFDYRLVDSDKQGYTRVFLVIAQTGTVRQRLRCIEDSGLSVERVTVTTDGWLSAVEGEGSGMSLGYPEQIVYLDVDSSYTDLLVAQRGLPLFSRSVPIGLKELSVNGEKAESDLLQEVVRALETYRNENVGGSVERLVLLGPAGKIARLGSRLQEGLTMTVTPLAGVAKVDMMPDDSHLNEMSVSGLLGAAMAHSGLQINLMPESMRLRKAVALKASRLTLSAVLVMLILALLSMWIGSRYSRRDAYLVALNQIISETETLAGEVESKQKKLGLVAARLEHRMLLARCLTELHQVASDQVSFTSIEIGRNKQMVCRGVAETVGDILKLVDALEKAPLFMNVKSTRTSTGKEKTEFEVVADIEGKSK